VLCHVIVINFIGSRNKMFSLNFSFLRIFSNWVLLNYSRVVIGREEMGWCSLLL
jgi:ABC-type enterochelin transport system permease subunit